MVMALSFLLSNKDYGLSTFYIHLSIYPFIPKNASTIVCTLALTMPV